MRKVHFVGSLPGTSAREALALVKEHAGNSLGPCLSDGETGDRQGWVIPIYEAQRRLPELEVSKDGDCSDWEHWPQLRVRKGSQFRKADLSMLSRNCTESLTEFTKFRSELGREDLDFMVGIISPLGLSYQIFGFEPNRWKPHVAAFQAAIVEQVREINRITKGNVIFQIEIPIEMMILVEHARTQWDTKASELMRQMLTLVSECEEGTKFGVHLCWGDLKWASNIVPEDASPIVAMSNAIAANWPFGREFVFLHAPFVVGHNEPPTESEYYEPLKNLKLADTTQFFAGFVDERLSIEQLADVRNRIESHCKREVGISSTCGLGRRPTDEAILHMQLAVQVADTP